MTAPLFSTLTIIGAGLIGSSLARAAQERKLADHISVYDADPEVRARVRELGFATSVPNSAAEAVTNSDVVFLCVPMGAISPVATEIAAYLKPGCILSDVGSVKSTATEALCEAAPKGVHVVPAHPVAGTEKSGPDAGFSSLFEKRWCILTPKDDVDPSAIEKITLFWQALGSHVEKMTPAHHDLVLAITSHIPHLIAYNIVGTAAHLEEVTQSEVIKFSAGGFRDFTRIAASDPTMWRDVFLHNKEAVLEMLGRFNEDLSALQRAIRWGDGEKLHEWFTHTRAIRRSIIEAGQE